MSTHSTLLPLMALTYGLAVSSTAAAHPGVAGHRHIVVAPAPQAAVKSAPRAWRPAARANCAAYGCSGEVTRTGPYGNTVTRKGAASCADGTCTRSGTITGPRGSAAFDRSFSR